MASNPTPWHIEGQTILDADGNVVVSAINPCDMNTRRLIVHAVNAGFWLKGGKVEPGSLRDIEEDIRERASVAERHGDGTTHNDGVAMLLRSLADRIKDAAWHEERLMLSLMLYAVEDYVEDWASDKFKACVRAACERLGLEYRPSAKCLQEQIADRIGLMDGEARVMCKLAPDRHCVDCELCKGEEGGDGE